MSGSEDTTWHFWPLLWQNGGQILNDDQTKATFNSPEGVKALEVLRAMAVDDKSMYLDQTDEKYPQLMYDGKVAMIIGGPWLLYDLKDKKVPYGATILPGTNGDHQTVTGPDVWVAFDHSDANRAKATTDFLLWLTSPEVDERWNLAYGNLPLRSSEAVEPGVPDLGEGLRARRAGVLRQPQERQDTAPDDRGLHRAVEVRRRGGREGPAGPGRLAVRARRGGLQGQRGAGLMRPHGPVARVVAALTD